MRQQDLQPTRHRSAPQSLRRFCSTACGKRTRSRPFARGTATARRPHRAKPCPQAGIAARQELLDERDRTDPASRGDAALTHTPKTCCVALRTAWDGLVSPSSRMPDGWMIKGATTKIGDHASDLRLLRSGGRSQRAMSRRISCRCGLRRPGSSRPYRRCRSSPTAPCAGTAGGSPRRTRRCRPARSP
jgi:hypothetical protein